MKTKYRSPSRRQRDRERALHFQLKLEAQLREEEDRRTVYLSEEVIQDIEDEFAQVLNEL